MLQFPLIMDSDADIIKLCSRSLPRHDDQRKMTTLSKKQISVEQTNPALQKSNTDPSLKKSNTNIIRNTRITCGI